MRPTTASRGDAALPTAGRNAREREDSRARRRGDAGRQATGPRTERALTLAVAAMEYIWLYDHRHGMGVQEIAARHNVSVGRVRFGLQRAAALDSKLSKDELIEGLKPGRSGDVGFRLVPLFPIGSFTPQSACPHRESIGRGSRFCCMVCHASGMDDHPGLRRDTQTEPAPALEPAPASEPAPAPGAVELKTSGGSKETRKQRRRRQFAEAAAVA
jgi:hypothetical protein